MVRISSRNHQLIALLALLAVLAVVLYFTKYYQKPGPCSRALKEDPGGVEVTISHVGHQMFDPQSPSWKMTAYGSGEVRFRGKKYSISQPDLHRALVSYDRALEMYENPKPGQFGPSLRNNSAGSDAPWNSLTIICGLHERRITRIGSTLGMASKIAAGAGFSIPR